MLIKGELRKHLKGRLAGLSPEDVRARSSAACALLCNQPEYHDAEIIMVFLSLPGEINTTSLVLRAWQDRKRILAPRVGWEQRRMIPVEIRSLTEDVEDTPWNFRQPTPGVPVPVDMIDLVVVPGLGFDAEGNRLGRGRGFYDRFLAQERFHGRTCALAFEEQFVDSIPAAEHDVGVQMLVTDQKIRRFNRSVVRSGTSGLAPC